jgi:uncharacterized protein (DUF362 family)
MPSITINYNKNILQGTLETLDSSSLKNSVHPGMKVSIKPNLVTTKPPELGATTHGEIVEGLIQYLRDLQINDIEIIESSWLGTDTKQAFHVCGYDALSKKYDVPLYDLKDDNTCKIDTAGYSFEVCRKAVETDFLINVPVLKAHLQTKITCNLKNLKGCIPDREKRRFHTLGLHGPIAYLNKAIISHFCFVDGICGNITSLTDGHPVKRYILLAGTDPLLLDSYCAELIGYRMEDIEYLRIASEIGVGRLFDRDTEVMELNSGSKMPSPKYDDGVCKRLSAYINEDKACSACYAALIFALQHTSTPRTKINIGQGFRWHGGGEIGCGTCTSMHDRYITGCPPKAIDIIEFLVNEHEVIKKGGINKLIYDEIKNYKLAVFGAGITGLECANNPVIKENILFFIDNDIEKQKAGIKTNDAHYNVYSIDKGLSLLTEDMVILIASPKYKGEMHEQLLSYGIKNMIIFN